LRDKKRTVEDADILTAAFCKSHDFILVTHNVKHFELFPVIHICHPISMQPFPFSKMTNDSTRMG
jgi:predicted nucleic acid-binding protein